MQGLLRSNGAAHCSSAFIDILTQIAFFFFFLELINIEHCCQMEWWLLVSMRPIVQWGIMFRIYGKGCSKIRIGRNPTCSASSGGKHRVKCWVGHHCNTYYAFSSVFCICQRFILPGNGKTVLFQAMGQPGFLSSMPSACFSASVCGNHSQAFHLPVKLDFRFSRSCRWRNVFPTAWSM